MTREAHAWLRLLLVVTALMFGLAVLTNCGGPERETRDGWVLAEGSLPDVEAAAQVLAAVAEFQPWCDVTGRWGGEVFWFRPGPNSTRAGYAMWWSGVPRIEVAAYDREGHALGVTQTALAHEAAHIAQLLCGVTPDHSESFRAVVEGANR